jgi:ubiquinol-cytochrome c reductase cytochrome c1 subunit
MRVFRMARTGLVAASLICIAASANAVGDVEVEDQDWSFEGIFGHFDNAATQRGFQVYRDVCAGCHSMNLMSYRYLEGIGLPEATVDALASQADKTVINDDGEEVSVPRLASDKFPAPYPNENAARATNAGALPPDLSLMAKAREDGPNYIYALLTGYHEAPADVEVMEGMYYNTAFPGHQIAMSPPLSADLVTFSDGTPATVEQMAHDVVNFMMFAAEPHLEDRKRTGLKVVGFLIVLTVMLYFVKKKVWSNIGH